MAGIGDRVRALLDADADMLARNGLADLASEIHAAADTLDQGINEAAGTHALLAEFDDRITEVTSRLMGVEGSRTQVTYVDPIDIVNDRGDVIGRIEIDPPDIDPLMNLSVNITAVLGGHAPYVPSLRPRVQMRGHHQEPEWAARYPYRSPETSHTSDYVRPNDIDQRRARTLTMMTGTSHPNAALLSLHAVGASYAETIHDGIKFTVTGRFHETQIRVNGADPCQVEVRRATHSQGTRGVLARYDSVPAAELRQLVESTIGTAFDSAAADRAHAAGIDATPPDPSAIAAEDLWRAYSVDPQEEPLSCLAAAVLAYARPAPVADSSTGSELPAPEMHSEAAELGP